MAVWRASSWHKKKKNCEMLSPHVGIIISISFGQMISPRE